jgi:hypothetical protein
MDVERAVDEYVARGLNLFRQLRSEGNALSLLAVRMLRSQLHVLGVEASRLERKKISGEKSATHAPAQLPVRAIAKEKSCLICEHGRLIDYCLYAGKRTGFLYCLECRAVFKDPTSKAERDRFWKTQGNASSR